jgi:hypothetical protein
MGRSTRAKITLHQAWEYGVPEIKRFGGFKLLMFFHDENPPHVHFKVPDFAAKVRLSNGDLIAGEAPNKILREARHWIARNRARLLRLWNELQS